MADSKTRLFQQGFVDPGVVTFAIGLYNAAATLIGPIQGYGQNVSMHLSSRLIFYEFTTVPNKLKPN